MVRIKAHYFSSLTSNSFRTALKPRLLLTPRTRAEQAFSEKEQRVMFPASVGCRISVEMTQLCCCSTCG